MPLERRVVGFQSFYQHLQLNANFVKMTALFQNVKKFIFRIGWSKKNYFIIFSDNFTQFLM